MRIPLFGKRSSACPYPETVRVFAGIYHCVNSLAPWAGTECLAWLKRVWRFQYLVPRSVPSALTLGTYSFIPMLVKISAISHRVSSVSKVPAQNLQESLSIVLSKTSFDLHEELLAELLACPFGVEIVRAAMQQDNVAASAQIDELLQIPDSITYLGVRK